MHVPEGWEIKGFEDIGVTFIDGDRGKKYPKKDDYLSKGYCLFLGADNISTSGTLDLSSIQFITEKKHNELRKGIVQDSDILLVMRGNGTGRACLYSDEHYKIARINSGLVIIRLDKTQSDKNYFLKLIQSNYVQRQFENFMFGSAQPQLTIRVLRSILFPFPPLAEQEKIAEILSTWDHAIEQTERLKANAETHKQALMQQLLTGKKRFPEFEGEWEEYKTKQIFKSIVRRAEGGEYEIFSVTKDGIIPQKEYFKKEIASKNTDNYKVIEFGDFVMSGLNFWMGSVDVYLEEYSGMISPAYKVYTIKKGFDISYIKHFVRSFEFNRVLVGSSILGASIVRRNFDSVAFDNWKLKLPSLEEQQKIAAVLNRADREIELLAQKLDYLKTEKRALMQQLLTGKRRVKVDG